MFNKDLRRYVRDNKLELSARKIKKETLNWKSDMCPILFAKAADCAAILQYVNYKLQEHFDVSEYPSLVACVWAANTFSGCIMSGGVQLTQPERDTVYHAGMMFLETYVSLGHEALERGELYFKVRPKLHYLQHIIESVLYTQRKPRLGATYMDEDWVRHAMATTRMMSHRTCALNVLRRFCVITKAALDRQLQKRH